MKPSPFPKPLIVHSLNGAVSLGILEAALESITDTLGTTVGSLSGQTRRDQSARQELVAECDATIRAARAGVLAATDAVWELASAGAEIPRKIRAQFYTSFFSVTNVARDTASWLYSRETRAAFMKNHPLERALRNLHAMAYAYDAVRSLQHSAGRVLLGGVPLDPMF